jgi:hypothetical protein
MIDQPCVFRWSPEDALARGDLLLFHETNDGPQPIHVETPTRDEDKDVVVTGPHDTMIREIAPGGEITDQYKLPRRFRDKLQAGETYRLRWRGSVVDFWEWGSKTDYEAGREMTSRRARNPQQPSFRILAEEDILIKAVEESEPWPGRPVITSTMPEWKFDEVNHDELRWRANRMIAAAPPLDESDRSWV